MRVSRLSRAVAPAAMLASLACASPTLADDPRDPTMTPDAIARDRAAIRKLNRDQIDYVQRRDAGYAQGWRDHDAARRDRDDDQAYADGQRDYAAMREDYARQRRDYERALDDWRGDVNACRAGYYERCDRR
ncbi:hypothetical protein [Novosphingobium resinovorum]|uniref:hypothetical protein n=1 Tax=Novosphingobium resinovorum TaxID=158500 RepID=UPI002ED226F6|nr:hypothetical protein [Novosphingobium resinovorum]